MLSGYVPEGSALLVPDSPSDGDESDGASVDGVGVGVGAAVGADVGVGLAFHFATTVKSFCGIVAAKGTSAADKIAAGLEADGILTGAGKAKWHTSTVSSETWVPRMA